MRPDPDRSFQILRCDHCGDVIGTYEPMMLVVDGAVRETSAAADPDVPLIPGPRYHRACFAGASANPAA